MIQHEDNYTFCNKVENIILTSEIITLIYTINNHSRKTGMTKLE